MKKNLEIKCFKILKKEVVETFLKDFPNISSNTTLWKGMHIMYFQEHLFNKTKGNISDRWFYTYFKSENNKVPRIDMLNILSKYCNYKDWDEFMASHMPEELKMVRNGTLESTSSTEPAEITPTKSIVKPKKTKKLGLGLMVLAIISSITGYMFYNKYDNTYTFYFRDTDRNRNISGVKTLIPSDLENPVKISDKEGKIEIYSEKDTLQLIINSTFYKKDTFNIKLNLSDNKEVIELTPNDYVLMFHYYSKSQKSGIDKRKTELNRLIAENALIYQVYDNENYGQEVYSKAQYISLMTTPTTTLKNYELIETDEKNAKITRIKFKILPNDDQE